MPNYIDLFGIQIENNREKFIQYLTKGLELKFLKNDYKKQFLKHYFLLDKIDEGDIFDAIGIDASGKKREFINGTYFYLNRASGVQNNGEIIRKLEADVFTSNGTSNEINTYFGRKGEYIEHKVLKTFLDNQDEGGEMKVCFIDGSLYSRLLMPHLIESPINRDETFILTHLETLFQIFKEALNKNVLLMGISKDSRDSAFRNALLDEIFYEERANLIHHLKPDELHIINAVIKGIDTINEENIREFYSLVSNEPNLLKKMKQIYDEYNITRTDSEIVYRFAEVSGFTYPLEKGLGRIRQQNIFNDMIKNPENFVRKNFRKYISNLNEVNKNQFISNAIKIIRQYSDMPTFISFQILIDIRDNPIKVDFPSWYFKNWHKLLDFPHVDFFNISEPLFKDFIKIVLKMYGGFENYNLLLSAAHDDAVLRNKTYNEIYEQILQDKLDILLPFRRRTRRELGR